jgi:hypothetical protein
VSLIVLDLSQGLSLLFKCWVAIWWHKLHCVRSYGG